MSVAEYMVMAALVFIGAFLLSRLIGFVARRVIIPILESAPMERYFAVNRYENEGADNYVNEDVYDRFNNPVAPPLATTATTEQQSIATPATDSNDLLLRNEAATLAKLVKAGKVGETEGIKIIYGVAPSSSNPRYLKARAMLKEELAKLEGGTKYHRTPEQAAEVQKKREELGLA